MPDFTTPFGSFDSDDEDGKVKEVAKKYICPKTPARHTYKQSAMPQQPQIVLGKSMVLPKWDGGRVNVTPTEYLGSGDFGTAYGALYNGNPNWVLKIDKEQKYSVLAQELYQYKQLKEIGFPVVRHEDLEATLENRAFVTIYQMGDPYERIQALTTFVRNNVTHGYHLREYVDMLPADFNQRWDLINQLKGMFKSAYDRGIEVDLLMSNIGIKDNRVVLFDLMPQTEHDDLKNGENPFALIVRSRLDSFREIDRWLPEAGCTLIEYLDPRRENNPVFNPPAQNPVKSTL